MSDLDKVYTFRCQHFQTYLEAILLKPESPSKPPSRHLVSVLRKLEKKVLELLIIL